MEKHRFGICRIKRLHDYRASRECPINVVWFKANIAKIKFEIGFNPSQIFGERVHLLAPQLVTEEELAVEIRFAHNIEVGDDEMLHPGPYEMHGAVRAESARTGDADNGVFASTYRGDQPDWTFSKSGRDYSSAKLYVFAEFD